MKATYQFCNIRSLFFCCSLVACRVQKEQENLPLIYFSKGKSQKEQKGELEKVSLAPGWLVFSKCWFLCILFHTWELFRKKMNFKKSFYSNYVLQIQQYKIYDWKKDIFMSWFFGRMKMQVRFFSNKTGTTMKV